MIQKCGATESMPNLKVIFQSSNSVEIYHKKALLEDQNIPSIIEDEHTNQWAWHLSQAIGGVKLSVKEKDYERAYHIIYQKPLKKEHCPKCNSINVYFDQYQNTASVLLSIFIFLFPFPIYKNKWVCSDCQHSWKAQS